MEKILTIFVTSYNTEKYIDEVMPNYLKANVDDDLELLFINDGSTDGTLAKLEKYQIEHPKLIRIISQPNGGFGTAVNTGLQNAKGEFVKEIDGDDWADPDNLAKYIDVLKKMDSSIDLVFTPSIEVNVDSGDNKRIDYVAEYCEGEYSLADFLGKNPVIHMHDLTFRTSIIQENSIQVHDGIFYVDHEYCFYPLEFVKKVYFVDLPIYQYRIGNLAQSVNPKSMYKNRKMHYLVILDMIDFLNRIGKNDELGIALAKRIDEMVLDHAYIYFAEKKHLYDDEFKSFLDKVKNYSIANRKIRMLFQLMSVGNIGIAFARIIYFSYVKRG